MNTGISLSMRQLLASTLDTNWTDGTTGATFELFQNNFVPGPLSVIEDFEECDFVGYARKTGVASFITFNDGPSGDQIVSGTVLQLFAAGAIEAAQTAYGWLLVDAGLTELLAWGVFDVPYAFNAEGDSLEAVPIVRLPLNTGATG